MIYLTKRSIHLATYFVAFLATASATSPSIPSFSARRDYLGLLGNWVQVADTNGDKIPDLIVSFQGSIEVLFGNGDGTFRSGPGSSTNVSGGSFSFIATDVNGDGRVDLVLQGSGGIAISLGNGDGTFQSATAYPIAGDTVYEMVVGDFNGDGILDVAAPGRKGVWLFAGIGGGAFNPGVLAASVPSQWGGGDIAAADFNRDGKLDLAVTLPWGGQTRAPGKGTAVLMGNGDGTFQSPLILPTPKNAIAIAAGPLTKNGYPSIAITDATASGVFVFDGNGVGGFSSPRSVNLPGTPGWAGFTIGDVNGDGIPDLISVAGYIVFGTASGNFKSPVNYPVQEEMNQFSNVVLADLRNNGSTDIVTNNYNGLSVLLSRGKGRYQDGDWIKLPGVGGCGAPADYNRDGKPDLAVITATGVSLLLGTGEASAPFSTGATIAVADAACLVSGDLNGDGIPDLLVATNGSPNALITYLGVGDGTFTLKSTTPTPNSGGYIVLADFNHDGKLDFATSGNLLALGNGDGTFQTPLPIVSNPPSGGFANIAVGDINGDGWPDLVLPNGGINSGDNGCLLINNKRGSFTQLPWKFGSALIQAILADLNGDGYFDLVFQTVSGGAEIYLGNGTGTFTHKIDLIGGTGGISGIALVADLSGDGVPDIALQWTDTLEIYLGQGDATYAAPIAIGTGLSPGSLVVEDLHGQLASSGRPDIVVPDYSGGIMVLINGTK